MRFDSYVYLWPPRPTNKVDRSLLHVFHKRGWLAQYKMNGTCNVISVTPNRDIIAMTRHKDEHKSWSFSDASSAAFRAIPGKGWYVFVAELMHSKIPGIRDTNYINEILVADGEYLVGTTFADRQARLSALFLKGGERETESHHVLNENTWLAKTHTGPFGTMFDRLSAPEHEGLVLKDPKAKLAMCLRQTDNSHWQVKIRRPTKTYQF